MAARHLLFERLCGCPTRNTTAEDVGFQKEKKSLAQVQTEARPVCGSHHKCSIQLPHFTDRRPPKIKCHVSKRILPEESCCNLQAEHLSTKPIRRWSHVLAVSCNSTVHRWIAQGTKESEACPSLNCEFFLVVLNWLAKLSLRKYAILAPS